MIAITFLTKIQKPQTDESWMVGGACFPQSVVMATNLKKRELFLGGEWAMKQTTDVIHLDSPEHGSFMMPTNIVEKIYRYEFQECLCYLGRS